VRPATSTLIRRLAALPETRMREVVLVEALAAMVARDAVHVLAELLVATRGERVPAHLLAASALAGALGRLPYGVASSLYEAARGAGLAEVAGLFFSAASVDAPPDPERWLPGARRTLTLGARKSLARGGRREMVAQLLGDPDAQVIRALLDNPRLVEKDVVAIAARRPNRADVLRELFVSRWRARYHVKRALVMNPWTPSEIAVRLVPSLVEADRRLVAADPNLAPAVRTAASRAP
jgi:hypothetical protein